MAGIATDAIFCVVTVPIDDTKESSDEIDGEDVVRIKEEACSCNENGTDIFLEVLAMPAGLEARDGRTPTIQPKWDLVDLRQRETTAKIRVGNVRVVVPEIGEGAVSASGAVVQTRGG